MDNLVEWKNIELSDYLDVLTGYSFSSKNFNDEEGIPLIRIRDLLTHNPVTYYKGSYDEKYIVNKDDILVGMDGEFNIVKWKGPRALLNQRVAKLESKDDSVIDNRFIYYRLGKELKRIEALTPATTVKHLSKKDIHSLNLSLPSLNEQQKIAQILIVADEQINNTEQLIQKTRELKKGLMQQLLTKGIGHTEFKQSEIGEVPVEWIICPLESLSTRITYGFTNPMPTTDNGPYMITAKDIIGGKINYESARKTDIEKFENDLTLKSKPAIDDILITKDGSLGRLAIVDRENICINQSVASISIKKEDVNVNFLFQLLLSSNVQRRILGDAGGSTIKHIYITKLAKMLIAVPQSLEEQKKIAKILSTVDQQIEIYEQEKAKQLELKKGLMQQLLTGKVRVTV